MNPRYAVVMWLAWTMATALDFGTCSAALPLRKWDTRVRRLSQWQTSRTTTSSPLAQSLEACLFTRRSTWRKQGLHCLCSETFRRGRKSARVRAMHAKGTNCLQFQTVGGDFSKGAQRNTRLCQGWPCAAPHLLIAANDLFVNTELFCESKRCESFCLSFKALWAVLELT